jgi:hypothetical protein
MKHSDISESETASRPKLHIKTVRGTVIYNLPFTVAVAISID